MPILPQVFKRRTRQEFGQKHIDKSVFKLNEWIHLQVSEIFWSNSPQESTSDNVLLQVIPGFPILSQGHPLIGQSLAN